MCTVSLAQCWCWWSLDFGETIAPKIFLTRSPSQNCNHHVDPCGKFLNRHLDADWKHERPFMVFSTLILGSFDTSSLRAYVGLSQGSCEPMYHCIENIVNSCWNSDSILGEECFDAWIPSWFGSSLWQSHERSQNLPVASACAWPSEFVWVWLELNWNCKYNNILPSRFHFKPVFGKDQAALVTLLGLLGMSDSDSDDVRLVTPKADFTPPVPWIERRPSCASFKYSTTVLCYVCIPELWIQ